MLTGSIADVVLVSFSKVQYPDSLDDGSGKLEVKSESLVTISMTGSNFKDSIIRSTNISTDKVVHLFIRINFEHSYNEKRVIKSVLFVV